MLGKPDGELLNGSCSTRADSMRKTAPLPVLPRSAAAVVPQSSGSRSNCRVWRDERQFMFFSQPGLDVLYLIGAMNRFRVNVAKKRSSMEFLSHTEPLYGH